MQPTLQRHDADRTLAAAWAGSLGPLNYRLPEPARRILLERLGPATFSWAAGPRPPMVRPSPVLLDWPSYVTDPIHPAVVLYTSARRRRPRLPCLP